MHDRLTFLTVIGGPVADDVAIALYCNAQRLAISGDKLVSFDYKDFAGAVETTGESATLGSITGQRFTAIIETDGCTIKAGFIIRHNDLELPQIDYEDVVGIRHADPRAATAHLN